MSHAVLSRAGWHAAHDHEPAPGAPAVEVSRSGAVAADLPCRRCSANLAGLPVSSHCRGCGAAVGLSLYGELLKYGHPGWVRGLALGTRFCLWGTLLGVAATAGGALTAAAGARWLAPAAALAAGAVFLRGAWLLTATDPAAQVAVASAFARGAARAALLLAAAGAALPLLPAGALRGWDAAASAVAAAAVLAGQVGVLRLLQAVARRVPSAPLARRARIVRWGYCGALAVALATSGPLLPPPLTGSTPAAYAAVAALLALGIYGAMYAVLLNRLRRAVDIQSDYARGLAARARAAAA